MIQGVWRRVVMEKTTDNNLMTLSLLLETGDWFGISTTLLRDDKLLSLYSSNGKNFSAVIIHTDLFIFQLCNSYCLYNLEC